MTTSLDEPLHDVVRKAGSAYSQAKAHLAIWQAKLTGPVTAHDGVNMLESINQTITQLQSYIATAGFDTAAVALYPNAPSDPLTLINTLITNLQAAATWISANLPNPSYTTTQTAPLLTLLQTAYNSAV